MGIYVKKKRISALRILLVSSLVIFASIIITYHLIFSDKNKINILNNLNTSNTQFNEKNNFNTELDSNNSKLQEINLTEYFTKSEFDQSIKNFIKQNPDFILAVLREYQLNQNKLEQEKLNKEKITSIQSLNQQAHHMYLNLYQLT